MGKAKAAPTEPSRKSPRLKSRTPTTTTEAKKKVVAKRAPKAKKTKLAENGSNKPEEPKVEAAESK